LLLLGLSLLVTGCATAKKKKSPEAVKAEVAESFARLQEAIDELRKDDANTEKLWGLLAEKSQDDAGKKAKAFRTDFAKRDQEEQADLAREVGATAEQIREKLTGFGYLRMMRPKLYERYWMMVAAEVDHVNVTPAGDEATVYYIPGDTERDKKSIDFVREDGQWRAILGIP
jgi:hypothetical protein